MREHKPSAMRLAVALSVLLIAAAACGGEATIVDNIVSTQVTGSADDNDSESAPQTYTAPADLDAEDRRTKASSVQPKFDEVAGKAEAEAFDPSAGTLTGDAAVASSFNKVVSEFKVTRDGAFTFDIDLDVDQVELRHDATVSIRVKAVILDAAGAAIPNAQITDITHDFQRDPTGGVNVILGGDTANPDSTQTNGDYNRTLSGPSGGISLKAGNYRIELDLRITARALVQVGPDGQRHRASVKGAKASIKLR